MIQRIQNFTFPICEYDKNLLEFIEILSHLIARDVYKLPQSFFSKFQILKLLDEFGSILFKSNKKVLLNFSRSAFNSTLKMRDCFDKHSSLSLTKNR